MLTKVGKFSFTIPADSQHEDAGKPVEKSFDYSVVENDAEAQEIITSKKWSLVGLVNEALKRNSRSNAYQTALLPYRPTEVSQDDIVERMVRDYIRLGFAEDIARKQVLAMLATRGGDSETTETE